MYFLLVSLSFRDAPKVQGAFWDSKITMEGFALISQNDRAYIKNFLTYIYSACISILFCSISPVEAG